MEEIGVSVIIWCPQRPNLFPIQMLRDGLDRTAKAGQPQNDQQPWKYSREACQQIDPNYLEKPIRRTAEIFEAVIQAKGGQTYRCRLTTTVVAYLVGVCACVCMCDPSLPHNESITNNLIRRKLLAKYIKTSSVLRNSFSKLIMERCSVC